MSWKFGGKKGVVKSGLEAAGTGGDVCADFASSRRTQGVCLFFATGKESFDEEMRMF